MNPDKVEVGSQSVLVSENSPKNGHLPRWVKVPAFTARTLLAVLTTTSGVAVATDAITRLYNPRVVSAVGDICNNTGMDFVAFGFAKSPDFFDSGWVGPNDIWMGSPQFGKIVIQYTENSKDPNASWREVGRFDMVNNGIYSLAKVRLNGLRSNAVSGAGEPVLLVGSYFEDDNARDIWASRHGSPAVSGFDVNGKMGKRGPQGQEVVVRGIYCGLKDTSFMYHQIFKGGRLVTDDEIEKNINGPSFTFINAGTIYNDYLKKEFNNVTSSALETSYPTSQENRRQVFQKYLNDKKKQTLPPPTATQEPTNIPVPTKIPIPKPTFTPGPAPTPTPTPTFTPEPTSTPVQNMVSILTPKPTGTMTPIPSPTSAPEVASVQVAPTATRISEVVIDPAFSSPPAAEKGLDLLVWLEGFGATFLAGIALIKLYQRRRKSP